MKKILKLNRCLFLGYDSKKTTLINFLRSKKIKVTQYKNKKLSYKIAKRYDYIISFGYRKIISKKIISKIKRPIINLHISYLPYNRGAYSNFWSFINNTPKGVTIHEIDNGIDTGKIIFRKKISFKLNNKITFQSTYKVLILEIEKLFKKKYKMIISNGYKPKKQLTKTRLNLKKDLPNISNWDISIKYFISSFKT
tara:strand:- start:27 stop:614 length:588 start_codon:yes stop_codon:yes gene_type:complete